MLKAKAIPTRLPISIAKTSRPPRPIEIGRARFLVQLLLQVSWSVWMARLGWFSMSSRRVAWLVRTEFERLGGLWIKAARNLAMRRGTFPADFCDELSKIRDWATSLPYDAVQNVIEQDLGRPLRSMFREFDVVPIASTTIGQVHAARLRKSDVRVAIKVQRPRIEETLRRDLWHIRIFLALLQVMTLFSLSDASDLRAALAAVLRDELDYRLQAEAMREARRLLRKSKIYVPKVFSRYCKRHVLVTEFLDGVLLSDYAQAVREKPKKAEKWRVENEIDLEKLRLRLLDEELLYGRRSRGRLRRRDIMLLRNNRIALLNFGSMGVLEKGIPAISPLPNFAGGEASDPLSLEPRTTVSATRLPD